MSHAAPVMTIDGGHRTCARLLVLLRNRIAGLPDGSIVHLVTTDPVARIDLPAWCRMTGHGYLGPIETEPPTYAIRVSAEPAPTDSQHPWRAASRSSAG